MTAFQTITPIDGSAYVEREYSTDREVDAALDRAREAQKRWRDTEISERAALCSRAIDLFVEQKSEIAEELTWQMGRPIAYAPGEVAGVEERARYMISAAADALAPEAIEPKPGFSRYIRHEPVGVVFVVAPWNYPYLTSVNAVVPALLAGNAVILKHSVQTPLCAERYAGVFNEAGLPEGVFQYLHTTHDTAHRIIQSDQVDFVAFTGSVPGGRSVEQSAMGRFIGLGLELGGKDPAYVRADADLTHAVETTADGAFFNSGQSCCGIERIYVHAVSLRAVRRRLRRPGERVPAGAAGRPGHDPRTARQNGGGELRTRTDGGGNRSRCARPHRPRPLLDGPGRHALPGAPGPDRGGPLHGGDDRGELRPGRGDHAGSDRRGGNPIDE